MTTKSNEKVVRVASVFGEGEWKDSAYSFLERNKKIIIRSKIVPYAGARAS